MVASGDEGDDQPDGGQDGEVDGGDHVERGVDDRQHDEHGDEGDRGGGESAARVAAARRAPPWLGHRQPHLQRQATGHDHDHEPDRDREGGPVGSCSRGGDDALRVSSATRATAWPSQHTDETTWIETSSARHGRTEVKAMMSVLFVGSGGAVSTGYPFTKSSNY